MIKFLPLKVYLEEFIQTIASYHKLMAYICKKV